MKKTIFMIAAAAVLVCSVSCKKETEKNDLSGRPVRLTATTENYGAEKTNLSGYALKWQDGDQISVMCENFTTPGIYQVQEGGTAVANFVYAGTGDEPTLTTPLRAGYPASSWDADVANITLPSQQNYVANSMEEFPMYGETETQAVNFKNLCGVVRMRLVKPGESVTKIVITANNYLNGVYSVDYNDGQPTLQHVGTTGTNGITLECAEPVSIENSTDFYIYLPAGTYGKFRIEVYNNIGLLCEINAKNAITIQRNKITTIAPSADKLKFTLVSGLISVSKDENNKLHYVRFATGNLLYTTDGWKNADNQWDFFNTFLYNGRNPQQDRFIWSSTNSNFGLGTDASGDFVDWGEKIPGNWRTLSRAEYNFAKGSNYQDENRGCKSARARILVNGSTEYAEGLLLMPDSFDRNDLPQDIPFVVRNFTQGTRPSGPASQINEYTLAQWKVLQTQFGATFIPCKNTITGADVTASTAGACYWTSTTTNTTTAATSNVNSTTAAGTSETPTSGRTQSQRYVRLVQDYEPLVIEVNE